ncbi:MAG: cytochrome c biogenesis protein CcmG/thiol:disulfide interchange protein DsbE [Paraglaciecola sp.]|jgi:cytochrome c biogenesis protein CcmG/thiol:disulfide interchange protein DsbE
MPPLNVVSWRIAVFVLLLTLTFSGYSKGQSTADTSVLPLAPVWSLYNEAGTEVQSSEFAGKPLILHFWATWCPYCKKLQPGLDKLYRKYRAQGLQMIAVSIMEEEGAAPQAELDSRKMSFNTLIKGEKMAQLFYVQGTPTTIFINSQGQVVASTRLSDPDDPRLEKVVKSLLTEYAL